MKTLEEGQKKIKKISESLRHDVLEPAKMEAEQMIEEAKVRAQEIIAEAERNVEQIKEAARVSIEQERNVFHSSLEQASKQSLEMLRQEVEKKFFNENLQDILNKQMTDPKVIANLLTVIIETIQKEGFETELEAVIPKTVSPKDVIQLLADDFLKNLNGNAVSVGDFSGGVRIKLLDKKMTLEITDAALKEMIVNYIRKDFRKLVFGK